MEGRLGRLISKLRGNDSRQQTHADIERRLPGINNRLEDIRLRLQEPHIEHELRGVDLIPVFDPGSTVVESAIQAGIKPPTRTYLTPDSPLMSGSLAEIPDSRLRHEAVNARIIAVTSSSRR